MVQFVVLIFNLHDLPLRTTQVDAVLNVQKDPDNNNRENSLQSDSTKKTTHSTLTMTRERNHQIKNLLQAELLAKREN